MRKISPEEYRAILRSDFFSFAERSFIELNPGTEFESNWHIEVMAAELDRCRRGETRRLIVNLPPRSLKSHCVSVAFVAWILGHNPSAQIICASYAQELANKHAVDCRALMNTGFYQSLFPARLSPDKRAVADFMTTARGGRTATSIGGVLTGRGADFIIVDDPLQPDKALSETRRRSVNDWYDHTLSSRLNHKRTGCIIVIMQRLHEDDLVGHLLDLEAKSVPTVTTEVPGRPQLERGVVVTGGPVSADEAATGSIRDPQSLPVPRFETPRWHLLRFPAIAEEDEFHEAERWFGRVTYSRRAGEALHPEREPLEILHQLRETLGEYHFAGQYQQSPAPREGGLVKFEWFNTYTDRDRPESFDFVFQSWDTANKATELNDYSVCTTWGVCRTPCDSRGPRAPAVGAWGGDSAGRSTDSAKATGTRGGKLYLVNVLRRRMEYPELKREVRNQAQLFGAKNVIIEDKASGTQLIQELIREGMHGVTRYQSKLDKVTRMSTATSTIQNGFVYLPEKAHWLACYVQELMTFPNGKYDDQADSTSQALDWAKQRLWEPGILQYYRWLRENPDHGVSYAPRFRMWDPSRETPI